MFLILSSLSLDCFKFNSSVTYDRQRDSVNFTAFPSQNLFGDQLQMCNKTLNGKVYNLRIYLGNTSFLMSNLIYNNSNQISLRVECELGYNCSYSQIKTAQAPFYIMAFDELHINVSSIVGQYEIQIYDHLDCINGAVLAYDIVQNTITMEYTNKAKHCKVDGAKYNYTYTSTIPGLPPFKLTNAAKTYLTAYFDGVLVLQNSLPFLLYPKVFPLSNITPQTDPDNFINDLNALGPITQFVLPTVSAIIQGIKQNKIKVINQDVQIETQVQFVNQAINETMNFNTTISYYVTEKYNILQDDCLINVNLFLEGNDFIFKAEYNTKATKCGQAYINSLKIQYNSISFYLQVIQNDDYTGLYYQQTFIVPDYELGKNINYNIPCLKQEDCAIFNQIINLYKQQPNVSFILQQLYNLDNKTVFRTTYLPTIHTRPHYDVMIYMRQTSLCIHYQPSEDNVTLIRIYFDKVLFDYEIFTLITEQSYCEEYTIQQSNNLKHIVQNKTINGEFNTYLNQFHVSSTNAIVYYLPDGSEISWLIMGIFFIILAIITIVLIFTKLDVEQIAMQYMKCSLNEK